MHFSQASIAVLLLTLLAFGHTIYVSLGLRLLQTTSRITHAIQRLPIAQSEHAQTQIASASAK
jgi:hypothetical protein